MLASMLFAPAGAQAVSFAAPIDHGPVPLIESVEMANLNADGDLDLVTAANFDMAASVLLGDNSPGGGGFSPPTEYLTGAGPPFDVAAGDFDQDGDRDLASTSPGTDELAILTNDGTGFFTSASVIPLTAASGLGELTVGEFDGNSDPDLAIVGGASVVAILLGTGAATATFSGPVDFPIPSGGLDVAVGDFNAEADADDDLAIPVGSGVVGTLLGDGIAASGTFGASNDLANPGAAPNSVAVADFNGDLDPDLAVANEVSGDVAIFLGAVGGTFSAGTPFPAGGGPRWVTVGEFSGDSDPDLAVANFGADTVSVLTGLNGGTFAAPVSFPTGDGPLMVDAGDLNGDEKDDIVTANGNSEDVSVLLNTTATAAAPAPVPTFKQDTLAALVSGTVTIRCPGQQPQPLTGTVLVGLGCVIDATRGRVAITAADGRGGTQTAEFYDGAFKIRQLLEKVAKKATTARRKVAITELVLVGRFCGKAGKSSVAQAAGGSRRLWGSGRGKFRTKGSRSSGTVRGTTWLTQDTCRGTLTRVTAGVVQVRDFGADRLITLRAGKSYLAKASGSGKKK